MPAIDTHKGRPAKKRRQPRPSNATQAQYAPHPVPRRPPRRRPAPRRAKPAAFQPITSPKADPIARAQHRAARRAHRARARLGDHPAIPSLPVLPHYTHRQRNAVRAAYKTAARKAGVRRIGDLYALGSPRQQANMRAVGAGVNRSDPAVRRSIERRMRDVVRETRPPRRIQAAGINVALPSLRQVLAATSLDTASAENQFARHALSDVGAIATGPFVGGYEVARGAIEAAGGHPDRLRRLGSGIVQSVRHEVTHPEQAFREHPLLFGLDLAGGVGAVGRVGGALGRAAKLEAASTVRSPLALIGEPGSPLIERGFSKDVTRKAAQYAADARREPLRHKDGSIVYVRHLGRRVPVLRARPGEARRLARSAGDFVAARAVDVERLARHEAAREFRVRGIHGRRAKDLVSMVVEGTITSARHFEQDLRAHKARIEEELRSNPDSYRHTGELRAARDRLQMIDAALRNPRVMAQAPQIVKAGEDIGRRLNAAEKEAIRAGILHPKKASRSRLVPAAVEHLGARHFTGDQLDELGVDAKASIRRADGTFLSNAEVEDFLRSRGRDPGTVAYLPHRMDVRGARAFHTQFRPGARPLLDKEARTGAAYRRGTTEASARLVQEQGVRLATQVAKSRALDRLVSDYGLRHEAHGKMLRGEPLSKAEKKIVAQGGYLTGKEAKEIAERVEADTGERLVAMRAFGSRLDKETRKSVREMQDPSSLEALPQRLLSARVLTAKDLDGTRARNVVLMPAELHDRLMEHLKPAGSLERVVQYLNVPFRMAVLPQPRWLTGNFVEPYAVRLATIGSGVVNIPGMALDIAAAEKVLRRGARGTARERQASAEVRAQQLGGLFIGNRGAVVRRSLQDVLPKAYGQAVRRMPVLHTMAETARVALSVGALPLRAFFAANRIIESVAQRAVLGRSVRRDMQEFHRSWIASVRLGQEAIAEASKGLVNTSTQHRFLLKQYEVLGKYEGFSPLMRRATQSVFPFLPWMLNAARFIFWTMPAHRTTQTALLIKSAQIFQQEFVEAHASAPPGSLRYAHRTAKGGYVDIARYTPYGVSAELSSGDLTSATNQFIPQSQGVIKAAGGKDPFGRDLRVPKTPGNPSGIATTAQRLEVMTNELVEALIPYVATARRLQEGGGTAYANSTVFAPKVKPGTKRMSAARRTFDPFRPTYLNPKARAKRKTAPGGLQWSDSASKASGGLQWSDR